VIEHLVRLHGMIGSPAYPMPEEQRRERIAAWMQRAYRPGAVVRQMAAIAADGDRTPLLARIAAPTHVIHGAADPLVPLGCGQDLARRIRGATLDVVDGMGHDLPEPLWPRFVAGIAGAAARAQHVDTTVSRG